jgi:uncharacterized protein (DUF849 family)
VSLPPLILNILLGSLGTQSATPSHLTTMVQELPPGSTWAAAGIGRFQFYVNTMAVAMGGHVRVGLEDNLWLDRAKTRPATNGTLVERVTAVAEAVEREIATPREGARADRAAGAQAHGPRRRAPGGSLSSRSMHLGSQIGRQMFLAP